MSPKNFLSLIVDRKCQRDGGSFTNSAISQQSLIVVANDTSATVVFDSPSAVVASNPHPFEQSFGERPVDQSTKR
ncbi:unnamed protein product [Camellia sinensis]